MVTGMSWVSCLCIHSFILAWYVFVLDYEDLFLDGVDTRKLSYGGNWKYLIYVNVVCRLKTHSNILKPTYPRTNMRTQSTSLHFNVCYFASWTVPK